MKTIHNWNEVPTFESEQEEAAYWLETSLDPRLMNASLRKADTRDSTTITLRFDPRMLARIKRIARENGVDWRDIVEANSWIDPLDLPVGQSILIPGVAAPVAPGESDTASGDSRAIHPGYDGPIAAEREYVWPLRGTVAAHYGKSVPWRMWTTNRGIDIRAQSDRSVVAAKSGRVNTFASVPGFGRAVVLEHTDGATTFYGHLDRILVKHGRWVKRGEEIGLAGSSGATSGTALHFRILRGGAAVNPLLYLP